MSDYLKTLQLPADIRTLPADALPALAEELRTVILDTVSKTGGHLASNLGTVELTIALLRVFNPPDDKVVWDVGHQSYSWKLLTGRCDQLSTLRQHGGLSSFPKPARARSMLLWAATPARRSPPHWAWRSRATVTAVSNMSWP